MVKTWKLELCVWVQIVFHVDNITRRLRSRTVNAKIYYSLIVQRKIYTCPYVFYFVFFKRGLSEISQGSYVIYIGSYK